MKATKLFHDKATLPDGSIVEMTIWQLATANPERPHGLKYSLYYGRAGERLVGYDNERGKGDHKHISHLFRLLQVTDMSYVEKIKDSMAMNDLLVVQRTEVSDD